MFNRLFSHDSHERGRHSTHHKHSCRQAGFSHDEHRRHHHQHMNNEFGYCFERRGRGGHDDRFDRGRGGRGRGGDDRNPKLRRLFEHGDLRIVMLALLAKKPSHGYELIKAIEEATSGLYTPSPGVIYPTLTLLEEQELIDAIVAEKGRKRYQITEAGQSYLQQHNHIAEHIFARLAQASEGRPENFAEGITDVMHQFRGLMRKGLMNPDITPQQVEAVNDILSRTIAELEQVFAKNNINND